VNVISPSSLPEDPDRERAIEDARLVAKTCRSMLALPVFAQDFPIQALAKMSMDQTIPPRERCNCLRTLALVQMKILETLGRAEGSIASGAAQAAAIAHVEQTVRVEVVREGNADWRAAEEP
jgi:hypothetical protein